MSLIHRQPRPIPRDIAKPREVTMFVLATEDTHAPKQYFGFFRNERIHVEVLGTNVGEGSDPQAVVRRLETFADKYQIAEEDQLWALIDTDHWVDVGHRKNLVEAIQSARRRTWHVAMSNPCFDLWLLLHHEAIAPGTRFGVCRDVGQRIRAVLGEFNKANLKAEHYPPEKVKAAIARARAMEKDENFKGAAADYWPGTAGSRVCLLMEALAAAGLVEILA